MEIKSDLAKFCEPVVPPAIKPYICWGPQCSLNSQESMAFTLALQAFSSEYLNNDQQHKMCMLNIILLSQPEFTMRLKPSSSNDYGKAMRMVLFPLYTWRATNLSLQAMIIAILEELCHIFYVEDDELKVEDLVMACAKNLWPDVRKGDVYNLNWKSEDGM